MIKLRLRTKLEAILGASLFMVILLVSVVVGPRIISDTHDDVDTFIRNSNGNYWEATGANIQTAIDDLTSGGTVWLPGNTTMTISSQLFIPYDNINLIGAGNSTIITTANGMDYHMVGMTDKHNILIENIQFDGNNDNSASPWLSVITISENSSDVIISDCYIHNFNLSAVNAGYYTERIIVENCFIEDAGIYVDAYEGGIVFRGDYCVARNNYIKDVWSCGIIFEGTATNPASHGLAVDNFITGNNNTNGNRAGTANGIHCEGASYSNNITICNNHIYDLNSTAYVDSEGMYSRGIVLSGDNSICYGNVLNDMEKGIYSYEGNNLVITDNRLNNCTSYPIYVSDSAVVNPLVMNNNIIGCDNDIFHASATNPIIKNNVGYDYSNYEYIPTIASSPYDNPSNGAMYFVTGNKTLAIFYSGNWYYYAHI